MKLIIFTTCKPFEGDDAWRQEQAIKSWTLLTGIEKIIIVIGNDKGTNEICKKYNLIHEPSVKNLLGVPYLHNMFEIAEKYSNKDDYLFWTNSDMIYYNDLIQNVLEFDRFKKKYNIKNFSLIGARYDWSNPKLLKDLSKKHFLSNINLNKKNTVKIIKTESKKYEISLHPSCGIDYVIYSPKAFINKINKNLVIAGTRHDMILVGTAIKEKYYTCDITKTNFCIHQNHVKNNEHNHNNRVNSSILIKNNNKYGSLNMMKRIIDSPFKSCIINNSIVFTPLNI